MWRRAWCASLSAMRRRNLKAGDSCSCLADTMHLFDNARGDVEALIYLVVERR